MPRDTKLRIKATALIFQDTSVKEESHGFIIAN